MARILLVDDDSAMLHFLAVALRRAGHEVDSCADGLIALNRLTTAQERPFDLLLTDVVMPGMDGIRLSQEAAVLYPDMKVMFMTGFSAVVMDRKEMRHSERVVSKPFHLKDLVGQVEQLLAA